MLTRVRPNGGASNMVIRKTARGWAEVHAARPSALLDAIGKGTDEQIRGLIARILRDAQVPAERAAKIMRVKRSQYFVDLGTPFPDVEVEDDGGDD